MSKLLAVCVCVAGLAAVSRGAETTPDEVARAMAARLSAIATLEQDGAIVVEFEVGGNRETTRMPFSFLYEKPGRLLMSNEFVFAVSTGENLYLQGVKPGRYCLTPLPSNLLQSLEQTQPMLWRSLLPDKRALFSSQPESVLQDYFRKAGARVLEEGPLDGVACWVLEMTARDFYWLKAERARVWVDQANGLIRRIESADGPPPGEPDATNAADDFRSSGFRYEVARLQVNEQLEPERFAFKVDARARKVAGATELFGVGDPGLTRCALSGAPAPDFALPLVTGTVFAISDHKGEIVVLHFWATWCGPGVKALPDMKALAETFSGQGVTFVGISRDVAADAGKVRAIVEQQAIPYAMGVDDAGIADAYGVSGLPCVVVVDAAGVVQGRHVGYSPEGNKPIEEALVKLLAGEALPSAEPMTDEELEAEKQEREVRRLFQGTVMNSNFFALVWTTNLAEQAGMARGREPIQHRIPLRRYLVSGENRLSLVQPEDGRVLGEVTPPPKARVKNEQDESPRYLYLETPKGGVIVAVQTFYRVEERENGKTFYPTESALHGFDLRGELLWSLAMSRPFYINSLGVLPQPGGSDLLLVATWDSFTLISSEGKAVLTQKIGFNDCLEIADRNRDGKAEFYVLGAAPSCYEWRQP